ncbi:MAG TPA: exopolysaccharide biosynthesis polyprenyl glycosylphosphotransferase [Xanthobacteraceae bacterium]|nr:exopolysaccharide biosynthesis polyprenyl glycosylphosphotransferase [Xanthobacteraceae bacterium]
MAVTQQYRSSLGVPLSRHTVIVRRLYSLLAAIADAAAIVILSVATGALYHRIVYDGPGVIMDYVQIGALVAWLYLLPKIIRREYEVTHYINFKDYPVQSIHIWNLAFACLVALGFLTKTGQTYSRGWIVMFYGSGMAAIVIVHALMARLIKAGYRKGVVATRRLFLVGSVSNVRDFMRKYRPEDSGLEIVGTAFLPEVQGPSDLPQGLQSSLQDAVAYARVLRPDDVFILTPWSHQHVINHCIEAFMTVPASIHLGPEQILDRFDQVTIEKVGSVASLHLLRPPLSLAATLSKRTFDVVAATIGLIVLTPLFVIVAILIKLESKGPVFFLQRRYGFNQEMFRIVKFRTMTTTDDGDVVEQVTKDDQRVTRVGRFLRRWNIDELPQLFNVLRGEMSLVGPRPHAVAHDRLWGQKIARYARRHNMLPGITGWAQVNGFRGSISSDADFQQRIAFDLYYIDNWSMMFDLRILLLTIFSKKAYRNAY